MNREHRVPIMMSDEEIAFIDDWRFVNRIATRSDAIRRLCGIGMKADHAGDLSEAELFRGVPDPWEDIETAPRDGTEILVIRHPMSMQVVVSWREGMIGDFASGWKGFRWRSDAGRVIAPTHWKRLPPPPILGNVSGVA